MKMIGMPSQSFIFLILVAVSKPSMPGMCTSIRITSTCAPCSRIFSASNPELASRRSWSDSSTAATASRFPRTSSTMRTLARGGVGLAMPQRCKTYARSGRHEVDLAGFQVDAHQLDGHAVGEAPALAGTLAEELVARGVELEVVAAELGDVHQAVDEVVVEGDEQAERRDAGDAAGEGAADVVAHVIALEPVLDVAAGVVGAPLGVGAVAAERLPVGLGVRFVGQHRLDGTMHQQIRIAPDRRSEVHVGFEGEAEVADVARAVHRLLHRAGGVQPEQ